METCGGRRNAHVGSVYVLLGGGVPGHQAIPCAGSVYLDLFWPFQGGSLMGAL